MIVLAIVIAVLWAVSLSVQQGYTDRRADKERAQWADALAREAMKVDNLVTQIQANAQGYAHIPQTYGPASVPEERHVMHDETGLVEVELTKAEWQERFDAAEKAWT